MIDWNIQCRAHACQACRRAFADKESFHTLLYDQKQAYERLDICHSCWTNQFSQGATERKGFISHWQSIYTPPPAAPPDPIQKETAESLLRKLVELNQPEHGAARFILAAMLERKRLLKVKAQIVEQNRRIFIYEQVKSGDLFQIADPNLRLDQLDEVQRDVSHLLQHGVGSPAAAVPENAPLENRASPSQTSDPAPAPAATNGVSVLNIQSNLSTA